MNKIILLVLFVSATASAQSIKFIDNDWNKARAEAKQQNKYLFVDAYTDWCSWCKVMDKETFPNADVVNMMNNNFVALKLEMEHNYGVNVAMKYRVSGFPSFLIFTPDGKLVRKIAGYLPAEQFMQELKKTLNTGDYPAIAGISETVDLDFPDFYRASFAGKGKRVNPTAETVNDFLAKQKDWFAEVNYSVATRFASLLTGENRQTLFNNRAQYEKLFGAEEFNDVVGSIRYKMLMDAVKNKSEKELETTIAFTKEQYKNADDITEISLRINFYKGTENWAKMAEQVDLFTAKKGFPSDQMNDWAWNVYENCNDAAVVKKAIGWMRPVIEAKTEYATMDTYAALLYKDKQYGEAKDYATKAIELGKAEGQKTDETEALLKKIGETGK